MSAPGDPMYQGNGRLPPRGFCALVALLGIATTASMIHDWAVTGEENLGVILMAGVSYFQIRFALMKRSIPAPRMSPRWSFVTVIASAMIVFFAVIEFLKVR